MISVELKRLLVSLQECDVSYLLAEGFTLKGTSSIDLNTNMEFWIKPSLDNAKRVFRALKIFGTPMHGIKFEQLANPNTQFVLPCRPHRLEFYAHIPELDFEEAWQNREVFHQGRLLVWLIGRNERIVAAQSIMRPPDAMDADL